MKILYYTWNETYDIEETLDIEGHDVVKVSYPISSYVADKGFNDYIVRILDKDNFDCIFTMNYIPALAKISFLRKIKYIAWISDSPNYTTYSEMIHSPYNYIFHFKTPSSFIAFSICSKVILFKVGVPYFSFLSFFVPLPFKIFTLLKLCSHALLLLSQ